MGITAVLEHLFTTGDIKYSPVECEILATTLQKTLHAEILNLIEIFKIFKNPQWDYRKFLATQWNRKNTLLIS
jgi:hypothetical protein